MAEYKKVLKHLMENKTGVPFSLGEDGLPQSLPARVPDLLFRSARFKIFNREPWRLCPCCHGGVQAGGIKSGEEWRIMEGIVMIDEKETFAVRPVGTFPFITQEYRYLQCNIDDCRHSWGHHPTGRWLTDRIPTEEVELLNLAGNVLRKNDDSIAHCEQVNKFCDEKPVEGIGKQEVILFTGAGLSCAVKYPRVDTVLKGLPPSFGENLEEWYANAPMKKREAIQWDLEILFDELFYLQKLAAYYNYDDFRDHINSVKHTTSDFYFDERLAINSLSFYPPLFPLMPHPSIQGHMLRNHFKEVRKMLIDLTFAVMRYYGEPDEATRIRCSAIYPLLIDELRTLNLKNSLAVFTTNYEQSIENWCSRGKGRSRFYDGTNKNKWVSQEGFALSDDSVSHFYLHGSSRWGLNVDDNSIIRVSIEDFKDPKQKYYPLLLLPSTVKRRYVHSAPYKYAYEQFRIALQNARVLLIAGYSGRDETFKEMLYHALKTNRDLHVVIIDICDLPAHLSIFVPNDRRHLIMDEQKGVCESTIKAALEKCRQILKMARSPIHVDFVQEVRETVTLNDLKPDIDLYLQKINSKQFDEAASIFDRKLSNPLYFRVNEYILIIDLISKLFPDGNYRDRMPVVKDRIVAARIMTTLSNSFNMSGQPNKALMVNMLEIDFRIKIDKEFGIELVLQNSVYNQFDLGMLTAAKVHIYQSAAMNYQSRREFWEYVSVHALGRVLAFQGISTYALTFHSKYNPGYDAEKVLNDAAQIFKKYSQENYRSVCAASSSLNALLQARLAEIAGDSNKAAELSRKALNESLYAIEFAQALAIAHTRDFIRSYLLLGESILYCLENNVRIQPFNVNFYTDDFKAVVKTVVLEKGNELEIAGFCLTEAHHRCWDLGMANHQPDILLAEAHRGWMNLKHGKTGKYDLRLEIEENLGEAFSIANMCEYRFKLADIHLFCARFLEEIDPEGSLLGQSIKEHIKKVKACSIDISDPSHIYQAANPDFYIKTPDLEMLQRGMTQDERIKNGYLIAYKCAEELEKKLPSRITTMTK